MQVNDFLDKKSTIETIILFTLDSDSANKAILELNECLTKNYPESLGSKYSIKEVPQGAIFALETAYAIATKGYKAKMREELAPLSVL